MRKRKDRKKGRGWFGDLLETVGELVLSLLR